MQRLTRHDLKNLARQLLGVRAYRQLQRWLKPRRATTSYGSQSVAEDVRVGSEAIRRAITKGAPFAAGKIGATELRTWLEGQEFVEGTRQDFSHSMRHELHLLSGVFPSTSDAVHRFLKRYVLDAEQIDVLAVWFMQGEGAFVTANCRQATLVTLSTLEPYLCPDPAWSGALAGKRVVVVSPFARSIEVQYDRRGEVWAKRPEVLPAFDLRTVAAPLSDGLTPSPYRDWFHALDHLTGAMLAKPFDVALVGAGAFSLPLVAEAKRVGRVGIHTGGATQVLFGILGNRWDCEEAIQQYVTPAWVRPSPEERPTRFRQIENGCYW